MTFDEIGTRVQGAIDLIRGREDAGWRRLDLSADGFWNSFLALPVCLPAFLVIWLSHTRWLAAAGSEASAGGAVLALALIEVVTWLATLALFLPLATLLDWRERVVPAVIAANWGSVLFAYVYAVPAALALTVGLGPGTAFVSLVIMVGVFVAYWRLLAAALQRPAPAVAATFIATIALSYMINDGGQTVLGLMPEG